MALTVILDAGHGGRDSGAVFQGRQEKDDNLDLTLAVGNILEEAGINVLYTRTTDVYDTPMEKAMIANNSGADFLVSIHRNASGVPNSAQGVETLVFNDTGLKAELARNINLNLEGLGFLNRGVIERPNLALLRRTRMPAVMVEVGFIDSESDNELFDNSFQAIAAGIASAIIDTLGAGTKPQPQTLYRVQVGAYRNSSLANQLLNQLLREGYPAYIVNEEGYHRVQVGAFTNMDNAIRMERELRRQGYSTFITS